jgi:hypothetical protein
LAWRKLRIISESDAKSNTLACGLVAEPSRSRVAKLKERGSGFQPKEVIVRF